MQQNGFSVLSAVSSTALSDTANLMMFADIALRFLRNSATSLRFSGESTSLALSNAWRWIEMLAGVFTCWPGAVGALPQRRQVRKRLCGILLAALWI